MTLSRFVALQWLSFSAVVGVLPALPLAVPSHANEAYPAREMDSRP